MADLQSILGTMLASGMGGRSGLGADDIGSVLNNTGFGSTAPDDAYAGDTGRSGRSGLGIGPVAGLGALGYLAYKAFQQRQQNMQTSGTSQPSRTGGGPWGGSSGGGFLGGIFGGAGSGAGNVGGSLGDRLSRMFQNRDAPQPTGADDGAYPPLAMEDQHALLLIRAMITAANADGQITQDERQRVLSAIDEAGAGPDERRIVENELDHPQPIDALLRSVRDPQTAEQVYMASQMAIDQASEAERSYLQYLASRLQIDPRRLQQIRAA